MATPRAPRKAPGGVDVQLEEFELDLRGLLEFQLGLRINRQFWYDNTILSEQDNKLTAQVIDGAFMDLMHRYQNVDAVMDILEQCRILIQNVVWASMNVQLPEMDHDAWNACDAHIARVIDNAMTVYNHVVYAPLRTEMIMANHNAEVLQRTWRRCITDPSHLACRRRLEYEFKSAVRDLNAL